QTLRAALAWSYDLLTLAEQHVFARLAVMTGDCDLEAAEAVCREPDLPAGSVLDLLTRLVDKSLLLAEAGVTSARYRLLEPVRQYALRLLEADGTLEQVRERHAAYFLALAEQAAGELRGPEQIAWLDRLESEHDNLRAALLWSLADGDRVLGLRLAVALGPFWGVRGRLREGRDWLDRLLNAPGAGELPERLRVRALLADGRLAQWQGDFEAADSLLTTCIELAHQLGEPLIAAEALVHLGAVYRRRGDPEGSARLLDESLHAFRAAGDEGGIALALMTLGVTLRSLGETARSTELLEESLARFQQLGDLRWIATTQTMLGSSLLKQGKLTGAARSFVAGLAAHQAIGDLTFSVFALHGLGAALARLAALEPATQVYGVMLALCDRVGLTLDPVSQRDYDSVTAGLRAQLGAADFDRLLAEGRTLSPDQVLDGVSRVLGDLSAE
ncbi:MAG TPA: tetratricopeptide repeat protein, partial [Nitrolancea sp.]|nr:tetratricopeptide repeat protein [Nitrolancea sp.]